VCACGADRRASSIAGRREERSRSRAWPPKTSMRTYNGTRSKLDLWALPQASWRCGSELVLMPPRGLGRWAAMEWRAMLGMGLRGAAGEGKKVPRMCWQSSVSLTDPDAAHAGTLTLDNSKWPIVHGSLESLDNTPLATPGNADLDVWSSQGIDRGQEPRDVGKLEYQTAMYLLKGGQDGTCLPLHLYQALHTQQSVARLARGWHGV
jgi:hypothetical protein